MRYTVSLYDRLLEVKNHAAPIAIPPKNTKKRGCVKGLSKKSRFRLTKLLAMINRPEPLHFVTLTYREFAGDWGKWKDHFKAWKDLMCHHYPALSGLWRMEFQERGAPHFHLILWGVTKATEAFKDQASEAWLRIIGQNTQANRQYGVTVQLTDDLRSTGFYLSMYAAKDEKDRKDIQTGREWGLIRRDLLNVKPSRVALLSDCQERLLRRVLRRLHRAKNRSTASSYYRRLQRDESSFSTFFTFEESVRLVRFVMNEAEAISEHTLRIQRKLSAVRLAA
ncbi:MAG: hypothetical protein WC378_11430 [Opitutaceae bacterium]